VPSPTLHSGHLLRHLGSLLLGGAVGLGSLLVHREAAPLGLLLVLATSFAVAGRLLWSRFPATAGTYAAGWLAVLATAVAGRPEGDFAVASDVPGWTLLGSGFVMLAVALVAFVGRRRRGG
jgi:hypothetical protein